MPSTTKNASISMEFWSIYEALIVLFFVPSAFSVNEILHILMASDPPFWMLPMILGFFVSVGLLISTPKQPWTPVALALELTGITEGTLIYNLASGTRFTAIMILCGPFWLFIVFLVLSIKGVQWDEMGHIGMIAGGVEFIVKKITVLVKGIGLLVFTMLDKIQSLAGDLWGIRETSEFNARANLPPPYNVAIFSESRLFSKAVV